MVPSAIIPVALVPAVYPCGLESHVGFGSGPALARHDMAKELAPCHAASADAVSLYTSLKSRPARTRRRAFRKFRCTRL